MDVFRREFRRFLFFLGIGCSCIIQNYYVKIVLIRIRIIDEVENVHNAIFVNYTVFKVYKLYLLQHINQTDKSSTDWKHPNIYLFSIIRNNVIILQTSVMNKLKSDTQRILSTTDQTNRIRSIIGAIGVRFANGGFRLSIVDNQ